MLTQALGRRRAWSALALGETHDARFWATCGLVHSLSEPGQALTQALVLTEQLAQQPPALLASLKELVGHADGLLATPLDEELRHVMHHVQQPEAGLAIESFLARRTPR